MDALILNLPVLRQIGLSCFSDTQMRPGRCFAFDFIYFFVCFVFHTGFSRYKRFPLVWILCETSTQKLGSANVSSDGEVGRANGYYFNFEPRVSLHRAALFSSTCRLRNLLNLPIQPTPHPGIQFHFQALRGGNWPASGGVEAL